jgi:hypothetical protein
MVEVEKRYLTVMCDLGYDCCIDKIKLWHVAIPSVAIVGILRPSPRCALKLEIATRSLSSELLTVFETAKWLGICKPQEANF